MQFSIPVNTSQLACKFIAKNVRAFYNLCQFFARLTRVCLMRA
jgi:hypothetical protein